MPDESDLLTRICAEAELAAQTVYELDGETPLEPMRLPDRVGWNGARVFLKREDLSRIHSYKWRGAYNKLKRLQQAGWRGPVVATSAGNHAQGVAAAANRLGFQATVFMPTSTPRLKQDSVRLHGGDNISIVLSGDNFDQCHSEALRFARQSDAKVLAPFDDLQVIAGQATIAREILRQLEEVDCIFVPVGGGGLASGVSAWCKKYAPDIQIVGVEVEGQDSMGQSIRRGERTRLESVDRFCDGTAVAIPGEITFEACRMFLSQTMTVSNSDVCRAIQVAWESRRIIMEPSGAVAMAGMLKSDPGSESTCVSIVSGSNTDFLTIPLIARRSQMAQPTRKYFQFEIGERNGTLIELLDQLMDGVNIFDFQYGKTSGEIARPVLGFNADAEQMKQFVARLERSTVRANEVSGDPTVGFRVIPFLPAVTREPCFLRIDFPDRPGALRELMRRSGDLTNICYFNFLETGETVGHALIGFEFESQIARESFFVVLEELGFSHAFVDASRIFGSLPGDTQSNTAM